MSVGDHPVISPDSKTVAFIKADQVWGVALDSAAAGAASTGSTAAAGAASAGATNLFTTRGNVSSLQWSPDGKRLLFVANRTDHAIIGIYTPGSASLKWIAASSSLGSASRRSAVEDARAGRVVESVERCVEEAIMDLWERFERAWRERRRE